MAKKLVILRGPSGSGKSTYVRKNYPDALVCSADDFFDIGGAYEFDVTKLPQAHQFALSSALTAMANGEETIVIDGTHTRNWEWENYRKIGLLQGYDVVVVEFRPTTIEDLERCIGRNLHRVPAATVAMQTLRFEEYEGHDVTKLVWNIE